MKYLSYSANTFMIIIINNILFLRIFNTYFNLDSLNSNHIFVVFLRFFGKFFNIHISRIVSYYF